MNHRSTKIDHSFIDNTKVAFLQAKKLTRPVDCMTTPLPNTGESANQNHLSKAQIVFN